jgi:hypothetical protein
MEEIIQIKFKYIEMHLPESREAIAQARKLLDIFEETLHRTTEKPKPNPQKSKPEPGESIVPASEYNFQECEKFDRLNLPAHKAGKSTYWLSDDGQKVCIEREGYAPGLYVHAAVDDLKYLQDHSDQIYNALKKFMSYKKYHVTGFLKDVDVSTLSGEPEQVEQAEIKEPEEPRESPEQSSGDPKPKIIFFQEDTGFDYTAVQPKWVGRSQVYTSANGKMVIKLNHEIVLTTKDTVEKLLQYDEKDLNYCIRGINPKKQNILRVYLTELKKRGTQT